METMFRPKLFILPRRMSSMTPGRVAAQISHATSDFHAEMETIKGEHGVLKSYNEWKGEKNFGVVYILDVAEDYWSFMHNQIKAFEHLYHIIDSKKWCAGITHDPTYRILDGAAVLFVPVDTCIWFFAYDGCDEEVYERLMDEQLYTGGLN